MSNYTFDSDSLKYLLNKLKEKFVLKSEADSKVDKVDGKDLVTNDYTDEYAQLNNKIINDITISNKTDTEITLTFSSKNGDSSSIKIPYDKYKKSALFVDAPEKFMCILNEENKINYRYISSLKDGNHSLVVEIVKSTETSTDYQESYTYDEIPDYYLYVPDEEDIALRMYFMDSENTMTGITYLTPDAAYLVAEYILNEINDNAYPNCNDGKLTNFITNDIQNDDNTFTRTVLIKKEAPTKVNFRNTAGLTKINKIGSTITNMYAAFSGCTNLTGSPVCGNNVTNMVYAYSGCNNLTDSPVCGDNVTDMASAYKNCTNLAGPPVCGDNVTDMYETYYYCNNLTGVPVCGDKVTDMARAYYRCTNLTGNPVCGNNVINMWSTYDDCNNLTGSPVCGPNVTTMYHTYNNCTNLTGAPVCGPNVTGMKYTYSGCRNLYGDMFVYSNNVSSADYCFNGRNTQNQLNIIVNFGTKSYNSFRANYIAGYTYGSNLTWTNAGNGSIYCWNNTYNIVMFNMQTTNMYNAFKNDVTIIKAACGPNVTDMDYTYNNCINLTGSPVCGDKVRYMSYAYQNCINLTGSPVCGDKVIGMAYTYRNCYNLTGSPVCGPNVTDMVYAYYNCTNLTGSPVCENNVTTMYQTYYNCQNLTGNPVCGPNVTTMYYTYSYCFNLTGSPVCGENVTSMERTYASCYNLTGAPVCGPNVTDMRYTYNNCQNLTGAPVCGPNVTDMRCTYYNCQNLYGNMYVYSNNVSNATNCFTGRSTSNQLNIFVNLGTTSYNSFITNNITGSKLDWINDTANNRYYNTAQNIYIYPVTNVEQAYKNNEE